MISNPFRQHSGIENSFSPPLSSAGFPDTSLQFYDLPRPTDSKNIRLGGKTLNGWHVPAFRCGFPICPRVSFAAPPPLNSAS